MRWYRPESRDEVIARGIVRHKSRRDCMFSTIEEKILIEAYISLVDTEYEIKVEERSLSSVR